MVAVAIAAACTYERWQPAAAKLIGTLGEQHTDDHASEAATDPRAGHDDAGGAAAPTSLVFPGDIVAASGAYQMHLAMKNKAGGGVDPHAGHNH